MRKLAAVEIYRDGRVPDKDELRGHARRFAGRLGQQFRLRLVELLGAERSFFLQLGELVEFVCGSAGVSLLADIAVELLFRVGLVFDRAVAHPIAANDQVEQHPEERQEDQEEHPNCLCHPRQLVVAEEVAEDRDENPDPGEQEEELEDEEQSFAEADVCEQHRHASSVQLTVSW